MKAKKRLGGTRPAMGPFVIWFVMVLPFTGSVVQAQTSRASLQPIIRYDSIHHPTVGHEGMVVSQREIASRIGADILAQGGNAVDAAVAVGFALAVTLPRAGNLGGGGFMLVHLAQANKTIAVDYRETAPKAANKRLFLDGSGQVDQSLERFSHRSVAVPGTVAGLTYVLQRYGTLSLKKVILPAIRLAEKGILMDHDTTSAIALRAEILRRNPSTVLKLFKVDGSLYQAGDVMTQPDLARTLRLISQDGAKAFYEGPIAQLIVEQMQANDGLITLEDLKNYRAVERQPLRGTYKDYEIVSMPPPSSGGVHLIQMLNILENFPIQKMGMSAASLHIMAEAMKHAYADRSKHLGDPGFYPVPITWLTSKEYARQLASKIDLSRTTPSGEISPGVIARYESEDTTHFSVIDSFGNAVANTYTLNFSFGAGITVKGGGFLLNNEMADFTAKPGVPDAFGLVGAEANAIEAGKRPLSSMTPTIVFKNGRPYLVTGSPGGSRIITAVLQQLLNVLAHEMDVASAIHTPRIHHQWYPDKLFYEDGLSIDTIRILESYGHTMEKSGTMGSLQTIQWDGDRLLGSADPRRPGAQAIPLN